MDYITEAQVNKYKEDINWINGVYKGTSNIKDKDSSYIDTSNLFNNAKTLDQYTNALIKAVSENKSDSNQSIVIPLDPWFEQYGYTSISANGDAIFKEKNISPVSAIYKMLKENPSKFKRVFSNIKFYVALYRKHGESVFTNENGLKTYSREFKLKTIRRYLNGNESMRAIAVDLGLTDPGIVRDWVKKYREGGEDAIQVSTGRKNYLLHEERQDKIASDELKERIKYLEAENEYLKKSYSLILERNRQSMKK